MSWKRTAATRPDRRAVDGRRAVVTASNLERELRRLGLRRGGVLLVHASLSSLGYVVHGVECLRGALRGSLGSEGTLLVPTFTGESMDPACWVDPALPSAVLDEARMATPLYDARRSLPHMMGRLAQSVVLDPDARRSSHPLCSFAAVGPAAEALVADHDLLDPLGPRGPLGRALERDADVLLLGVDQTRNSAFYLAQCLVDAPGARRACGPFLASVDGERAWVTPSRLPVCSEGFGRIEDDLVVRGLVRVARVGDATCRLMRMRPLLAHLVHVLKLDPRSITCRRAACRQCGP